MKKSNSILVAMLVIVGIIVVSLWGTYNSLVSSQNNVEGKWAQVENVMQRRYDLVPNLVNSVKGSMKQEEKVFGMIAESRKSYANAKSEVDKLEANDKMGESTQTLINVVHEQYPELLSNDNVKTLMTQLEGSENRISTERKEYIDSVQEYNQKVRRFPTNIIANMFGFDKMEVYKADVNAHTSPEVNFDE